MKVALVSDIHANLQAWNSVLLDIRSQDIDSIICLGDIVGYGPDPAAVLESVYSNVDHVVLGNHDAVVCGKLDAELFNDVAMEIILWTKKQLGKAAVEFLDSLPLTIKARSFRCTHAGFANPAAYDYIVAPEDAMASWNEVDDQLLFFGHTHVPGIFLLGPSGAPHFAEPQDFAMEEAKRYIVNVGSVGQPRDGGARSCYCILDTAEASVTWRRVPFDLDAYREALHRTGVSEKASYFLRADPRKAMPPIREMTSFSPSSSISEELKHTAEVEELDVLKKNVTKWKVLTALLLLVCLAAATVGGLLWWRHRTSALVVQNSYAESFSAITAQTDSNIISYPANSSPFGVPVAGWSFHIGDKRTQSIEVASRDSTPCFVMISDSREIPLSLKTDKVRVEPGMKLCMDASFLKSDDVRGDASLALCLTRNRDGEEELDRQYKVKTPNIRRKGGWMQAKETFDVPADATSVYLEVRATFTGEIAIKDISLTKR
jgi:predicted phosphodiesterase